MFFFDHRGPPSRDKAPWCLQSGSLAFFVCFVAILRVLRVNAFFTGLTCRLGVEWPDARDDDADESLPDRDAVDARSELQAGRCVPLPARRGRRDGPADQSPVRVPARRRARADEPEFDQ